MAPLYGSLNLRWVAPRSLLEGYVPVVAPTVNKGDEAYHIGRIRDMEHDEYHGRLLLISSIELQALHNPIAEAVREVSKSLHILAALRAEASVFWLTSYVF
jgi:hypothetical protein